MAQQICPVCGLPKDLCVCQEIGKEEQRVKLRIEKRKWGREVTIIEGIDDKEVNLEELAAKLKAYCACGGTFKDGRIELQGDHRYKARDFLVSVGFSPEKIDIT